MKILLASDHGGFTLKENVLSFLKTQRFSIEDRGCYSSVSVDYPTYAFDVATAISLGQADRGILFCGTGIGMAIAANKIKGIRAAAINDLFSARMAREHNDLNILCLGGRVIGPGLAQELVEVFLNTPFNGARHQKRLDLITNQES